MLKVLPVQSKITQEELCLKAGIKYNPDALAYEATVDGRFAGICQFKVTDKGGLIYDLVPAPDFNNFEAMFVMGRGTLNFIDLCGVHNAIYVGEVTDAPLLKAVGFKENSEGIYEINLEGFFTDHCHHHKEEN
jgi:hypothetical protein